MSTIRSRIPSKEYMDNYDKIFNKTKETQAMQQSDVDQINQDLLDVAVEEGWIDASELSEEAGE